MPPRRPIAKSGTSARAKRPAPPVPEDELPEAEPEAVPGGEYKTGGNYVGDDEDAPLEPDEDDLPSRSRGGDDAAPEEPTDDDAEPVGEGGEDEGMAAAEDLPPGMEPETRAAPVASEGDDEGSMPAPADRTRAGPPTKVEIVEGPDAGKIKRFNGVRLVVGRTAGCDLKLTDGSVSRRHLELVQGDSGVLIRDLGSGNGTKVNGEKIDEQVLEDGDLIVLGKTTLKFVDEMAAFKKAKEAAEAKEREAEEAAAAEAAGEGEGEGEGGESSSVEVAGKDEVDPDDPRLEEATEGGLKGKTVPKRGKGAAAGAKEKWEGLSKRSKILAATAVGLLLVIVIVAVAVPKGPPAPDERQVAYDQKLELARAAIDADDFQEAVKQAEAAQRLKQGPSEAKTLAVSARQELALKRTLESAASLANEGKLDEAQAELDAVTGELSDRRLRQKAEVEQVILDKQANFVEAQVETAFESRDLEQIRAAISKLPEDRQAKFQSRVKDLEDELAAQEISNAKDAAQARAMAAKRAAERRNQAVIDALEPVERKFHAGDFARAAKECDRVIDAFAGDKEIKNRAKSLKTYIPQFEKSLDDGRKKFAQGSMESAVRPLRKAKDLYALIGFKGPVGKEINEMLAGAAVGAGRSALSRGDLATANGHFKDALRLNPQESRAAEGLDKVLRRAKDLYLEGYMVRDRDPREAKSKFRMVLDVLPKDEPEYQKAKAQLDALGP